jgi:hypothetical protein
MTPAWAITDYKVQGATYDSIIVDLHQRENSKGSESTSDTALSTSNSQESSLYRGFICSSL